MPRIGSRLLLFGIVAGLMLAVLRAPLGLGVLEIPAADARVAATVRSAALIAIALVIVLSLRLFGGGRWRSAVVLVGAAVGLAAGALLFGLRPLASVRELAILGALLGAALFAIGRLGVRSGRREPGGELGEQAGGEPEPEAEPENFARAVGCTMASVGAAVSLEAIARHGRLLTMGSALEESVLAFALVAVLAIGAFAFLPLFGSERARVLAVPLGLCACTLLCLASLATLSALADPDGWSRYIARFGMRGSMRGRIEYTLLLGGTLFALPGLAAGAALGCARGRGLSWCVFGAALGTWLAPRLLESTDLAEPLAPSPFSAGLVRVAILIASLGALVAIAFAPRARLAIAARVGGSLLALACASAAFFATIRPILVLSPWERWPARPSLVIDRPEGLFTVEAGLAGLSRATLDRRDLTPQLDFARLDARTIEASFGLFQEHERRGLRVLLVGVLTPGRALALDGHGASVVDRTATFHEVLGLLERALFATEAISLPEGEVLSPKRARERIAAGGYDLVLVPPCFGEPAPFAPIDELAALHDETIIVAWLDASESLAATRLNVAAPDERILLATDAFERSAFARVRTPAARRRALEFGAEPGLARLGAESRLMPAGPDVAPPSALTWLYTRSFRKRWLGLHLFGERLVGAGSEGGPAGELLGGFGDLVTLQRESSPFEDEAFGVELGEAALERMSAAARAITPDLTMRRAFEDLAAALLAKRDLDGIQRFVEPVALAHAPWAELELVLAAADLEGLLVPEALARLDRLEETSPGEPEALALRGRAQSMLGDHEAAIAVLRRALAVHPEPRRIELLLAAELVELEPARAEALLDALAGEAGLEATAARLRDEVRARGDLVGRGHDAHEH